MNGKYGHWPQSHYVLGYLTEILRVYADFDWGIPRDFEQRFPNQFPDQARIHLHLTLQYFARNGGRQCENVFVQRFRIRLADPAQVVRHIREETHGLVHRL